VTVDLSYRDTILHKDTAETLPLGKEATPHAVAAMRVAINGMALMSPLTGIGQYTFNLVREMQAMRLAPWLFYATDWRQDLRPPVLPGIDIAKNTIKRLIPRAYVVQRLFLQQFFLRGARRHDIQLYHEPNFMSYRFGGPTVVTVHDLAWLRFPETQPADRVREMNRIMPETVKRAAHIMVPSEFVRGEVIDHYGLRPDQVTASLLGVAPAFRPMSAEQCAQTLMRYDLQHGQYMLAVATLEPRKNLNTVLAAFSRLPQAIRQRYPLVIVGMRGWGQGLSSAGLPQMIAKGEVRLTGYVPQADLPGLYAGARLFAYPSLYEGFGLPPLEAMACGVPVIVSDRASLPEVVGDAGVLTEALDDQSMTQHMLALVENDVLHRRLSIAGVERAQTFTWRRCAERTLEVYAKVLAAV